MDGVRVRGRVGVVVAVAAALVFAGLPAHAGPVLQAGSATVTGMVQEIVVDNPRGGGHDDETRKVLRVGRDVIPLTDGSLPGAENGETVRATVAASGDGAKRVVSATTVAQAPGQRSAAGTHDVYAVVVRPRGIAADASLTTSVVTSAVAKAASYWTSQTGSQVNFRLASVAPSYISAYGCSDGTTEKYAEEFMWDEALSKISVPSAANQHLMIFVPRAAAAAGCSYGLGSIGFWSGKPGLTFVSDTNQSVVAHELGHNLSLRHSNELRCGTASDAGYSATTGWPSNCYSEEYGDLLDVMGYSGTGYGEGSLNAVQLDRMGLLPTAVQAVTTAGPQTVRIAPLSAASTTLRAVKITESSGQNYYVEYRTNTGRDTVAARNPWHPSLGVRVLRQDPRYSDGGGAYVLDATPSWVYEYSNNLAVGKTFTSAARWTTVTVTAADSAGATLLITHAARSLPVRAALFGLPTTGTVGATVTPWVKVTNQYGRPVPGWPVTLQRLNRGGAAYTTVATVRTDVNGLASAKVTQGVSAWYRYVTVATSGATARTSNAGYVTARAVVSAKRPVTSVSAGNRVTVKGAVSRVPSPVVYVQVRKAGGGWSSGVRATVSGTSVAGSVKLSTRGTYYVRLYLKHDASARYLGGFSTAYPVKAT